MTLAAGARLGPYEIVSALGAGGMGEVYRARDIKLGREVAIKVLPADVARDSDRVARFAREAQILASLNHPHIAGILHLQEADGVSALVMELVEGETLADRIARGPIPIDEALPVARQICEALEAAHDHGIIHRDLKPANIKITPDGVVKVLDFGLAKLAEPGSGIRDSGFEGAKGALSLSPTITSPALMTGVGVLLGTAAYMAPEQAKGKLADKRSDIWAFGCVLYEMLTGVKPFVSGDVAETLAAILMREPDWRALPGSTAPSMKRLLRRCLEKDPHERLRDIGDVRIELKDLSVAAAEPSVHTVPMRRGLAWIVPAGSLLVAVAAVAVAFVAWRAVPPTVVTRLDVTAPSTTDGFSFALSQDGRQIVFAGNSAKGSQLWLRRLDQTSAQPLVGTENAVYPFWAPDGRSLGFFADGKLKRLDFNGGAVQVLADAPQPRGGTWNTEGVILFSPASAAPLMRLPATGGSATPVTHLVVGQGSHRWPQFLPDSKRFIFLMVLGQAQTHGIYVASLDGGEPKRILPSETQAWYAPPGYLVRVSQGVIMAQPFDTSRAALSGDPFPVAQGVVLDDGTGRSAFSLSAAGALAYRSGAATLRQIVWVDRTGKVIGKVAAASEGSPANLALAPSGQRIALNSTVQNNIDVWLFDARGVASRFTFDEAVDSRPIWSPDGNEIVFESARTGIGDLFKKPSSGVTSEQTLLADGRQKDPLDWSRDGKFLLFGSQDPSNASDLWALPMIGEHKPFPIVQTPFDDIEGQFSPDSRLVAYASNESGRYETYVRVFPGPGGTWQVSTAGGTQPRWSPDGKEIFYLSPDSQLMSAPIRILPDARAVEVGTPTALFPVHLAVGGNIAVGSNLARAQYAVAPDGRFLMITPVDDAVASPITIVLNWTSAQATK